MLDRKRLDWMTTSAFVCVLFEGAAVAGTAAPAMISAPLDTIVTVTGTEESVHVTGTAFVRSTTVSNADGTKGIRYACAIVAGARGQTTGTTYAVSGNGSGAAAVSAPLPADIGIACPLSVWAGNAMQNFSLSLQGSLDAAGAIRAVALRDVGSR